MKLAQTILLATMTVHAPQILVAQQSDVQLKYQLAQNYERNNDWENAIRIYEELYARDSTNVVIFESLRRGYMQLKRHDDAIRIIQTQLRHRPNDITLLAHMGVVHAREGNDRKAIEAWNRAIEFDQRNVSTYYVVANAAIESRLIDRAVGFYLQGRSALGDPMLFAVEVAQLYTVMMNFSDATREYVKLLQHNRGQLQYVQTRMATYSYRADARQEAERIIEQALRAHPDNTALYQLFGWLLMEGKQFQRAFDIYVQLDQRTNASGREVYSFAERAFKEKAHSTASKAYQTIIAHYPKFDRLASVKFGYARSMEELLASGDSAGKAATFAPIIPGDREGLRTPTIYLPEAVSNRASVIARYDDIVREYPRSEIAALALYRIALIQSRDMFDLDGAVSTLGQLRRDYPFLPHRVAEATLLLGDVMLTRGDLNEAEKLFRPNLHVGATKEPASYCQAELEFFRGRFEDATAILQELTREPQSDIANDALSLLIFIQDNSPPTAALHEYAKASLLIRQRKFSEAILVLQSLERSSPTSPLLDKTLTLMGDLLTIMGRYPEAITVYERIADKLPESLILDLVLMKIGHVYQWKLVNSTEAIRRYQAILERFPQSLYANEARKRIRELRGENL